MTDEQPLSVKSRPDHGRDRGAENGVLARVTGRRPGPEKRATGTTARPACRRGTKAPWPEAFFPQLATLVARLPEGGQWMSEIKFDGYRLLARIRDGRSH